MISKKNGFTLYEEIDLLFDNSNQPENRIHLSVKKKIDEIKNRQIVPQLEERLKILALDEKKKESKKKTDSSVKDALKSKHKFNPLLRPREELEMGYFIKNPIDQSQYLR